MSPLPHSALRCAPTTLCYEEVEADADACRAEGDGYDGDIVVFDVAEHFVHGWSHKHESGEDEEESDEGFHGVRILEYRNNGIMGQQS